MIGMGDRVRDVVTGFTGVVIGRTSYINGCEQALVQPRVDDAGKCPDGMWIDVDRLGVVDKAAVTIARRSAPGGPPRSAPQDARLG